MKANIMHALFFCSLSVHVPGGIYVCVFESSPLQLPSYSFLVHVGRDIGWSVNLVGWGAIIGHFCFAIVDKNLEEHCPFALRFERLCVVGARGLNYCSQIQLDFKWHLHDNGPVTLTRKAPFSIFPSGKFDFIHKCLKGSLE
jgi:hypothetical protein